jgi:DNA polymerase I-like protein with 3'-5' exonuclease and polymerase domains
VRIVAWLADCRFLLEVFNSGQKIHKLVAARIYGKQPEDIESDSLEYDRAKKGVHAYDYMMRYKKLAIIANMPNEEAKQFLTTYGREVPEIDGYHQGIKETVIKTGRLVTPVGRVRVCYKACGAVTHTGQLPDEILRDLVSYIPQSTVPDVLNTGLWKLWNELDWVRWHQQGHDSYLASGPPERTEEFAEKSEQAAQVKFYIKGRECLIPGEFQWGYLWGAMLKYNPGEDTSYEAWEERAAKEGCFDEGKIKERLYAMDYHA